MTFLDWLVRAAFLWAVVFAFCASSLPDHIHQLTDRYRHGSTR